MCDIDNTKDTQVTIKAIRKGKCDQLVKLSVKAEKVVKLHEWIGDCPNVISGITHRLVNTLYDFKEANVQQMPTSGTTPKPLYHSQEEIDKAAREKVQNSDIPLKSVIAQHDYRQKQLELEESPSPDESVKSLLSSDDEIDRNDFLQDYYVPPPNIVVHHCK